MPVLLTETGYECLGEFCDISLYREWSNDLDVVVVLDDIEVREVVNTLGGADVINGKRVVNRGLLDTGDGIDLVIGGSLSYSDIGIVNYGMISSGFGNDLISGIGEWRGIENDGSIITGAGNDTIIGRPLEGRGGSGIRNSGVIFTGDGSDRVDALRGGYISADNGIGYIDLGSGDDWIRGFGKQIVDGGSGNDTAELGLDFGNVELTLDIGSRVWISVNGTDMEFNNVEMFVFNDDAKTLGELQATFESDIV